MNIYNHVKAFLGKPLVLDYHVQLDDVRVGVYVYIRRTTKYKEYPCIESTSEPIIKTYYETATGVGEMPILDEMIAEIPRLSTIWVPDVATFGRNSQDASRRLQVLHDKGCVVISAKQKIMSQNPQWMILIEDAERKYKNQSSAMKTSHARRRATVPPLTPQEIERCNAAIAKADEIRRTWKPSDPEMQKIFNRLEKTLRLLESHN